MQSSRAKRALFPERLRKPVPTFIELTSGSTLTVEEDTFDVMQQLGGGGSRLVKLTMRAGEDVQRGPDARAVWVNPAQVTHVTAATDGPA